MKKIILLFTFLIVALCFTDVMAQTTITLGTGTSSSSSRGPVHSGGTSSSTRYTRMNLIYPAAELLAEGITTGDEISELKFYKNSTEILGSAGDATLKIYIKNSSVTEAYNTDWNGITGGHTLVFDGTFNTSNNFPNVKDWVSFVLSSSFTYTGGALEVAIDWDYSAVGDPKFDGTGAVKWRYTDFGTTSYVARKFSSSAISNTSTLDANATNKEDRPNIQLVYTTPAPSACAMPTGLAAANITTTGADLSWTASVTGSAGSYQWKIVTTGSGSGGAAIDGGNTSGVTATTSSLSSGVSYDLFVETDCGAVDGLSGFAGPYTFVAGTPTVITIGSGNSGSSSRGPIQASGGTSTTRASYYNLIYTQAELVAEGITTGASITQIAFNKASENVLAGTGDATLKIYIKNSSATAAVSDTWDNLTMGASLVVDNVYNTTTNLPSAEGWMALPFTTPFAYTGGAIEVAVAWDFTALTPTPGLTATDGDGIKWKYTDFVSEVYTARKASSSSLSGTSTLTITANPEDRPNAQFSYIAPVPVEMTYFIGSATEAGNLLKWETASEEINEGFEVQKSADGENWEAISFVQGNGTTFEVSEYSYLDTEVSSDVNYYRLKQMDFDGVFDYSRIVIISQDDKQEKATWKTYPNPVVNRLTVEDFQGMINVYNVLGQSVRTFNIQNDIESISLSDLENGQYFLQMIGNDGSETVRRIVKASK